MMATSYSEQSAPAAQVETSTAENPQSSQDHLRTRDPPCSIGELQSVFGSILIANRHTDPATNYSDFNSRPWKEYLHPIHKAAKPIVRPVWTGSFTLFSLPRELRDKIYYHYLYRPEGVVYIRKGADCFLYDEHSKPVSSLFLTSRQVYDEALQVFCRYNQVEFAKRYQFGSKTHHVKSIAGTLRLFPDAHARLLQRVSISYSQYMYMYYPSDNDEMPPHPGEGFVQMLRDAYVFRDTFPRLREFRVDFCGYQDFFRTSSTFEIQGATDEEKIENCNKFFNWLLAGNKIVPPKWFRFHFERNWYCVHLKEQEDVWNEALARLTRQKKASDGDIEESGRLWIEEMAEKRHRRKRSGR